MKPLTLRLWKIIQILAVLASLTGITLVTASEVLQPFQNVMPYVAVISTGLVFILGAQVCVRTKETEEEDLVIIGREAINQECQKYIEAARSELEVIGGDLSWLPGNFSRVQRAKTERGVSVRILYRCSDAQGVNDNVEFGLKAKAEMACYHPSDDPRIRFLLVDREETHATLLVFKKISRPSIAKSPVVTERDGKPGNLSVFEYQAEVYSKPKHRALVISVSQLFDRMWNELYAPEQS
jgi:hypothetical protein